MRLCSCGSGRLFERCHGDSANAYAREQALLEARHIAGLFPCVRVEAPAVLAFGRALASGLSDDDELDDDELDAAFELVDPAERRRIVDAFVVPYADRWASLCRAAGDVEAAERELVLGALEVAVEERRATPRAVFQEIEDDGVPDAAALVLVVPPFFVWSFAEAHAAAAAAEGRAELAGFRAIERVGVALLTAQHTARVRRLASVVDDELPVRAFPRASSVLREAIGRALGELDFAQKVALFGLAAYAARLPDDVSPSLN